jgi:hypothetical protein
MIWYLIKHRKEYIYLFTTFGLVSVSWGKYSRNLKPSSHDLQLVSRVRIRHNFPFGAHEHSRHGSEIQENIKISCHFFLLFLTETVGEPSKYVFCCWWEQMTVDSYGFPRNQTFTALPTVQEVKVSVSSRMLASSPREQWKTHRHHRLLPKQRNNIRRNKSGLIV